MNARTIVNILAVVAVMIACVLATRAWTHSRPGPRNVTPNGICTQTQVPSAIIECVTPDGVRILVQLPRTQP